jgi:hypothetical protein
MFPGKILAQQCCGMPAHSSNGYIDTFLSWTVNQAGLSGYPRGSVGSVYINTDISFRFGRK